MTNLASIVITALLFLTIEQVGTSSFVGGEELFRHASRLAKRSPDGDGVSPVFASQESSDGQEFMTPDELNVEKKSGRRNLMYIGKRGGKTMDDLRRVKEQSDSPLRRSRIYIGKRSDMDVYDLDGSDSSQLMSSENVNWKYDPLSYPDDLEGRQLRLLPTNYFLNKRRSRLYIG